MLIGSSLMDEAVLALQPSGRQGSAIPIAWSVAEPPSSGFAVLCLPKFPHPGFTAFTTPFLPPPLDYPLQAFVFVFTILPQG